MKTTISDVINFANENDVKFVKLTFCDLLGNQKNISIMKDHLEEAFIDGISFDASSIKGFAEVSDSDLFLFPDASTLSILPWRPIDGRVLRFYTDVKTPENTEFYSDSRNILKKVEKRILDMGYVCQVGAECEFYLFKTDENGNKTKETFDNGGYLDIAPLDKCENIRREICLCLEEMGLNPESSHHEHGAGQNEIDFKYATPLECADNIQTFKAMVKAIASKNGLFASFLPKPLASQSGSGMHMNFSLCKNGYNIFKNEGHSEIAESFIQGVLERISEITLFLNPIENSYERLGKENAPKYISWSHKNRSQLIRIPASNEEKVRMELRSPDPVSNPYIAFALIISAGLDGIEKGLKLSQSTNENMYTADQSITKSLKLLPQSLSEAIEKADTEFVRGVLGDFAFEKFIQLKKQEIKSFDEALDKEKFFDLNYFDII